MHSRRIGQDTCSSGYMFLGYMYLGAACIYHNGNVKSIYRGMKGCTYRGVHVQVGAGCMYNTMCRVMQSDS